MSNNLPSELLAKLVMVGVPEGKWSPIAALEHIAHIRNSAWQLDHLKRLIADGYKVSWESALEVAYKIIDQKCRALALGMLAAHVPAEQQLRVYDEALKVAQNVPEARDRAWALEGLAPYLPTEQQLRAYDEALKAAQNLSAHERVETLERLAPYLSPEKLLQAAKAVQETGLFSTYSISSDSDSGIARARALKIIASYLPVEEQATVYTQALVIAQAITDAYERATTLIELALHLSPEQQPAIYTTTLATFDIEDSKTRYLEPSRKSSAMPEGDVVDGNFEVSKIRRTKALIKLAPHLPPEQQSVVYDQALEIAFNIHEIEERISIMMLIALCLPPLQGSQVYNRILTEMKSVSSERKFSVEHKFTQMLKNTIPNLPSSLLPEVIRMIEAIFTLGVRRALALVEILPYLAAEQQSEVLSQVLNMTQTLDKNFSLFHILMNLAPYLPPEQQPTIYDQALEIALAIPDDKENISRMYWPPTRVRALMSLAPYLPSKRQPAVYAQALEAAQIISDDKERIRVLGLIAPYLPAAQQPPALERVLKAAPAIADTETRTLILGSLAPHLSPEQQLKVFDEILIAPQILTTNDVDKRVKYDRILVNFAQILPPAQLPKLLGVALTNTEYHIDVLKSLIPHLPAQLLAQAFQIAQNIPDDQTSASLLVILAPHLPASLLAQAFQKAQSFSNGRLNTSVLKSLVLHLPPELIHKALATAKTIRDNKYLAELLVTLAPRLSSEQQLEVLEAIQNISDEEVCGQALQDLAPHLLADLQPQALAIVQSIVDKEIRSRVLILGNFTPHLTPEEQSEIYTQVLHATLTTTRPAWAKERDLIRLIPYLPTDRKIEVCTQLLITTSQLKSLIPHLPSALIPRALKIAQSITDGWEKALSLGELAQRLPHEQQVEVYSQALAAIPTIMFAGGVPRAMALERLVDHLPPVLLSQALEVARTIPQIQSRIQALEALIPYLISTSSTGGANLWLATIRSLAINGRPDFLNCLASLSPWLISLIPPEALTEVVTTFDGLCQN